MIIIILIASPIYILLGNPVHAVDMITLVRGGLLAINTLGRLKVDFT